MKKATKLFGLALALVALVGCTASFCSNKDKANMLANYADSEVTYKEETMPFWQEQVLVLEEAGLIVPSDLYFDYLEENVYYYAISDRSVREEMFGEKHLREYTVEELKTAEGQNIDNETIKFNQSSYYACIKFGGYTQDSTNPVEVLWHNFDTWVTGAKEKVYNEEEVVVGTGENAKTFALTMNDLPSDGFVTAYKTALNNAINITTACITPVDGIFGGVELEGKSWGDAFNIGLIEGLIEYPIAWMLDGFYNVFNLGAWGAVIAILFVTIIVRLFLLLVTFKSTLTQARMEEVKPQLDKIQQKYPNANTNEYEKRQLAEEQMKLYKENKINPMSMLLTMIIQFPVFIAVWGAMSGAAVLKVDTLFSGNLWALRLDASMNSEILSGNITAIILFVVMSAVQILSAKLPSILAKRDAKKKTKLGVNPAQTQQSKQMNMMSNVMMVMIIVMGFTLPAGMAIYWLISALIALAQSFIIRAITKRKKGNKDGYVKYKVKK